MVKVPQTSTVAIFQVNKPSFLQGKPQVSHFITVGPSTSPKKNATISAQNGNSNYQTTTTIVSYK